jgi:hypothetical protein
MYYRTNSTIQFVTLYAVTSIYLLTYLQHGAESSLEANRFSTSQKIHRILWNPKIHYHVYK